MRRSKLPLDQQLAQLALSGMQHAKIAHTGRIGASVVSIAARDVSANFAVQIANQIIRMRKAAMPADPAPALFVPKAPLRGYAAICHEMQPAYDPRHIEAFLRTQYGTLDHLSRADFRRECRIAARCVDEGGVALAEQVARSYGL